MALPKRVEQRLRVGLKEYQPILEAQRDRDVSEADTVTVVKDVLSDVFGYDKYAELTGEHAIRGTYCDLAIQLDGKIDILIEVKAVGLSLNDRHLKQAVDYAANQGVEWVILTNGIEWILYHVLFQKPIDKEEVVRLNLLDMESRRNEDLERLFLLTKEGNKKDVLEEYRDRKTATNRFMVAALLTNSDKVISAIRSEVRRVSDILVDKDVIQKVLREQVIKREALEGEQASDAKRRYSRVVNKTKRTRAKTKSKSSNGTTQTTSTTDSDHTKEDSLAS